MALSQLNPGRGFYFPNCTHEFTPTPRPPQTLTMTQQHTIIAQNHGMGTKWYCTKCDQYHNGHTWTIRWTNSKPPQQCDKCQAPTQAQQQAQQAIDELKRIYGDRATFPGDPATIANLLRKNHITGKYDPEYIAQTINQICTTSTQSS